MLKLVGLHSSFAKVKFNELKTSKKGDWMVAEMRRNMVDPHHTTWLDVVTPYGNDMAVHLFKWIISRKFVHISLSTSHLIYGSFVI